MSINVTVTGNPISIKRGKMVTSDSYQAKKEFEKRRLMRLEQVRQQSKDIAENVRNKVRKEKKKQMREIEEEGKEKLKNWQNRKLLELQTQYEEALQELGTGHKEAMDFVDENEILTEQKKLSDKIATHRGQVAATELQIQKNKENLKKAIPIQQKKFVRDIENTRASLVSGLKKNKPCDAECNVKTKKRKKPIADINITIPSSDSECSELAVTKVGNHSEEEKLSNVNEKEEPSTNSCDCTDTTDSTKEPSDKTDYSVLKSHRSVSPKNQEQVTITGVTNLAKQLHDRRKLIEEFRQKSSNMGPPLDTRISDRIKRRELMASQPDYCDTVAKTHPTPFIESNTQLRDAIDARNINNVPVEINCICGHKCPKICGSKFKDQHVEDNSKIKLSKGDLKSKQTSLPQELSSEGEIPDKPAVKLKEKYGQTKRTTGPSKDTLETYDSHKVKYYDHPNRFFQEKQFPSNTHVEKISGDSLEVVPDVISEEEWQQKMKQRDRDAQIRGQKALEKERIQKDYEEMLKKLPLLQKKERICEIAKDKQEYHMSEERLKERDRKKQNELDNAFNKLFPNVKPAVVTLPSKIHEKETVRPATDEPIQSLNIGNWDVDQEEPKMFTIEEVQEIVQAFTVQNPKDRRAKLKQLLRSLKLQKEQLINEIKSLPSNDSINELISDLKSFSDSDDRSSGRIRKRDEKSERKRRREEHDKETSTDSTTESSSTSSSKHGKGKKVKDKHKGRHHSDTKTPSPRKKQKIKSITKVLVLQNTSTQTTPKPSSNSNQDKTGTYAVAPKPQVLSVDKEKPKEKPICSKLHTPCDCNKENESTDELCQIVIKINDNEEPEVVVKSKERNVKVSEDAVKAESPKYKKLETKSIGIGTDELKGSPKHEKPVSNKVLSETQKSTEDKPRKDVTKRHNTDHKLVEPRVEPKRDKIRQVETTESKSKSWKEQLSKNSISTSSTSYFSPPDFQKVGASQAHSTISDEIRQSLYNLLKKPRQGNFRDISSVLSVSPSQTSIDQRAVDPRLLTFIQKLLSMSRGSVENLTVSTSSVQTPSQSVIEMESNNPLAQLHNLIKNYNMKDVERDLSYSPDLSPVHYNTSVSTSEGSQPQRTQEKTANLGDDHSSKSVKADQSSKGATDRDASSSSAKSKDSVLAQYAEITDSCSRRIAQLASMIEQIREEKIQMLQNPPAAETADKIGTLDKDYSTAYLDLPGSNDSSSKYSSVNSLDDEELQRRLLDIDFNLAEKLRKFTSTKDDKASDGNVGENEREGSSKPSTDEGNKTNTELWSRLQHLMQQKEQNVPEVSSVPHQTTKDNISFVPFLSDIPKLPKLEVQPETSKVDSSSSSHKRPPPSRGLSVAKKFNGNISLVPHELSTIVEADSQISTKIGSANNSRTSQDVSPRKDFELVMRPDAESAITGNSTSSKHSSKSNRSLPVQVPKVSLTSKQKCDDSCRAPCSEIVATQEKLIEKSKTTPPSPVSDGSNPSIILTSSNSSTSKKSIKISSSSSDDMETIESMLKSIGMEWAIPTLHKTKEALALTSSSSSLELSAKKQILSNSSSGSEVSLRQYLKKQIRISSSTLKSDASPASFSELSSIQANNSNADKSNQKTSTPIISSKSTERSGKRVAFSEDSDLSSVRDESQKHSSKSGKTSFRSLSDYSHSKSDT
ncbi:uncharacterized protein LOC108904987 [Anoplophora glabripennis]|uniref:uncharacterized protein LOC108904987 n=1 Tax=Anoplophora glabripennis TaxID=217634 RepID=UPI0008740991|nr:uncharacterized protein LOC108904987 [Anoplophora glabripennis]